MAGKEEPIDNFTPQDGVISINRGWRANLASNAKFQVNRGQQGEGKG
jgi:hypothetical protein